MTDIAIDADEFGATIEQLLGSVTSGVEEHAPEAVEKALRKGQSAWKKNAKAAFSDSYVVGGWGKDGYGRTITTGRYAASIKHHMLRGGGQSPEGEIGSPKMPGLPHLLEKGHARVGGGFVAGREHVAPAAQEAFDALEDLLAQAIEEAIDDA